MLIAPPHLGQVASQAQDMAARTKQEKVAVTFQTVAMVSMALMGVAAAAHLIRDLRRPHREGRGH